MGASGWLGDTEVEAGVCRLGRTEVVTLRIQIPGVGKFQTCPPREPGTIVSSTHSSERWAVTEYYNQRARRVMFAPQMRASSSQEMRSSCGANRIQRKSLESDALKHEKPEAAPLGVVGFLGRRTGEKGFGIPLCGGRRDRPWAWHCQQGLITTADPVAVAGCGRRSR